MPTRAPWSSNGLARYEDALAAATTASEHREVVAENWGLSELVEAATRCGRTDLAAHALNRLATKADAARTDWARGIEARSQALLAEAGDADRWYRTSIDHLRRTQVQAELARTHLLYGEWLRRHGHRRDARAELNVAHELFVSMGMEAFAQRADNELVGTGEKRRTRDSRAPGRSHRARTPDCRARPRRALEPSDRCSLVPQPTDRRMAPPPRVLEARHPVSTRAASRPLDNDSPVALVPRTSCPAAPGGRPGSSRVRPALAASSLG